MGGSYPLGPLWMTLWSRFYRSDLFFLSLYQFKCSHPIHQSSCKHQILYLKGNPTGCFRIKTQEKMSCLIFLRFLYTPFLFLQSIQKCQIIFVLEIENKNNFCKKVYLKIFSWVCNLQIKKWCFFHQMTVNAYNCARFKIICIIP